jgi:hypothetical protein
MPSIGVRVYRPAQVWRHALDTRAADANARRIEELQLTPGVGINAKILEVLRRTAMRLQASLGEYERPGTPARGNPPFWQGPPCEGNRCRQSGRRRLDDAAGTGRRVVSKHLSRAIRQSTGLAPH